MPYFTLSELESLKQDLSAFISRDALSTIVKDYLQRVQYVVEYICEDMTDTETIEFLWPVGSQGAEIAIKWLEGWKERRQQPAMQITSRPEGGNAAATPEAQAREDHHARSRTTNNPLVDFHVNHLVKLLQNKPEVVQKVLILHHVVRMVMAGAHPMLVQWHVKHVQNELLDSDSEIAEAAELLFECIKFMDIL